MDKKKYYVIEYTEWGEDWEEMKYFFFLTEKERSEYADELKITDTDEDNYRISFNEISFEKMKEIITVEEFEELFDITINDLCDSKRPVRES